MNRHIKYLLEEIQKFDVTDYTDNDSISTDEINHLVFNYRPSTKKELKDIIIKRAKENRAKPYLLDIDTSKITDMSELFNTELYRKSGSFISSYLEELDLSTWNTSNVNSMRAMFWECYNLKKVNISSFTTEKLVNVRGMFSGCNNLETIDMSSFSTYYIDDLAHMFNGCKNLKEIKGINSWRIDWVSDLTNIFKNCPDSIIPDWYK